MTVIFTSQAAAQDLVDSIDATIGYPDADNGTTTHDVPRKHPSQNLWAVALDGLDPAEPWLTAALDGRVPVERLPDDWFPGGYP